MRKAGCLSCHGQGDKIAYFENDWINLRTPEHSRILRAPLADGGRGLGLASCRARRVDPRRQRIHLLSNGYAHAVQPVEAFAKQPVLAPDPSGEPVVSFRSTADAHYQAMLAILRDAREKALAIPRVDMPGADVVAGSSRQFIPPPLPEVAPPLSAAPGVQGEVLLWWPSSAATIGLDAEVHRSSQADFTPEESTLVARTQLSRHTDRPEAPGTQYYALVIVRGSQRSRPTRTSVTAGPRADTGAQTSSGASPGASRL